MLPLRLFSGGCPRCRLERQWLSGHGDRLIKSRRAARVASDALGPGDFRLASISPAPKSAGFMHQAAHLDGWFPTIASVLSPVIRLPGLGLKVHAEIDRPSADEGAAK